MKAKTHLEIMESRIITNIEQIKEIIIKVLGIDINSDGDFIISCDILTNAKEFIEKGVPFKTEFAQYILIKC